MENKRVTITLVALSVVLFLGFSIQALAGETYKMGLSLAITGPTSDVGSPYAKGVEDYVKYVNDEKLLGEDKLECFIRDDGYKTEVIAASIRNSQQAREVAELGTHIATLPFNVISEMIGHFKTVEGMKSFTADIVPQYRDIFNQS